ncbi:Bax inhibitor-1/YccA family protein [Rheinheimera sp. 4Y26]|uniref:Bax inhibitor-1/YccA family protein n=1 Tax=Rheinheimera sp. 4Y26 TaxID=2977811 RepID=UPI0021B13EB2|nr:Bax inhibitor-1/YccA family protein [Rheinheimera sp. 4Y26]MCT6699392.1 Bax inhibitor-1/YccA family protein [Rheinheimera sp. 4Y26]
MSYQNQQLMTGAESLSINKVLRNTYMLLAMTLTFSAVTAAIAMALDFGSMLGLGLSILALVLVFVVIKTADSAAGLFWVFAFTGVMGASIGPMLNRYAGMPNGPEIIMQAFAATALIFFSLSAYTLTSKKDFSFIGNFLFVGLIMALVAGLANIFFQVPALQLAISAVIVLLMSGFILFDTSRIVQGGETNYIRATVSLYLNIFNLFTALLQLLGFLNSDE